MATWGCLLLIVLAGCGTGKSSSPDPQGGSGAWEVLWRQAGEVDTVGVAQIAAGDSTSGYSGLTIIETTVRFPPSAAGGEAFAWEAYVRALEPIKLLIFSYDRSLRRFQLVGESQTRIPERIGLNRFVLREPVPLEPGYYYGLHMPAGECVPFSNVLDWKALITTKGLQRPFMDRDAFAMYGWRYSIRVFWRPAKETESP